MRLGQKNGCVRQWAKRGTRPRQPVDQRYESAYVFGAVCPERDTGAALSFSPSLTHGPCSSTSMRPPSMSRMVVTPSCCSIMRVGIEQRSSNGRRTCHRCSSPPAAPSSMQRRTSGNIFDRPTSPTKSSPSYHAILDAASDAWNKLLAEAGRITSIAARSWAIAGH